MSGSILASTSERTKTTGDDARHLSVPIPLSTPGREEAGGGDTCRMDVPTPTSTFEDGKATGAEDARHTLIRVSLPRSETPEASSLVPMVSLHAAYRGSVTSRQCDMVFELTRACTISPCDRTGEYLSVLTPHPEPLPNHTIVL